MKVLIDINTKKVTGINRPKGPFEVEINMFDANTTKHNGDIVYTLSSHPGMFSMDELIEAKGKYILSNTLRKYIILNEELLEDDLSINLSSHSANTGFKFLQLLPLGQCRTNKINLPISTNSVGLYLEADKEITAEIGATASNFQPINNGQFVTFSENISSIYIRFKNNSDTPKEIYSYGIIL